MTAQKKFYQLSISMVIMLLMVMLWVWLGKAALHAYIFAEHTYGTVIDYRISLERPRHYNASEHTPEKHEILIEYMVNNEVNWLVVNSNVYSAVGAVTVGDRLIVSYYTDRPEKAYAISYGLFSPLASVLWPMILLCLIVLIPQWVYAWRQTIYK